MAERDTERVYDRHETKRAGDRANGLPGSNHTAKPLREAWEHG